MTRKEETKPENSSMAKNEKEIERLGKEMETMDTNKQVKNRKQIPDPIQHDKK
ncbi:MAG TPA: hypothetical protein VF199_00545 [Bacillales bacterium]